MSTRYGFLQSTFSVNATSFMDMSVLLEKYSDAYNVAAIMGLLAGLKIFKCVYCCWPTSCDQCQLSCSCSSGVLVLVRGLFEVTQSRTGLTPPPTPLPLSSQIPVHLQETEHLVAYPVTSSHGTARIPIRVRALGLALAPR